MTGTQMQLWLSLLADSNWAHSNIVPTEWSLSGLQQWLSIFFFCLIHIVFTLIRAWQSYLFFTDTPRCEPEVSTKPSSRSNVTSLSLSPHRLELIGPPFLHITCTSHYLMTTTYKILAHTESRVSLMLSQWNTPTDLASWTFSEVWKWILPWSYWTRWPSLGLAEMGGRKRDVILRPLL